MYATIGEHTRELRNRVLLCLSVSFIFFLLVFPFTTEIIRLLIPSGVSVVYLAPTDFLYAQTLVAFVLAVLVMLPVFAYHGHKFIYPEQTIPWKGIQYFLPPLVIAVFGFLFGTQVITPLVLDRMLEKTVATPMLEVGSVLDFTVLIGGCMALTVMMPYFVRLLGVRKSFLRTYRKHMVVGILLLTGILSADPTVVTQLLLSIPFILAWEVSIWFARR